MHRRRRTRRCWHRADACGPHRRRLLSRHHAATRARDARPHRRPAPPVAPLGRRGVRRRARAAARRGDRTHRGPAGLRRRARATCSPRTTRSAGRSRRTSPSPHDPCAPLGTPQQWTAPVSINAEGLHDQRWPYAKPPGEVRVLVLGDEAADGIGIARADRLSVRLAHLSDRRRGARVAAINATIPGYDAAESLRFLERRGAALPARRRRAAARPRARSRRRARPARGAGARRRRPAGERPARAVGRGALARAASPPTTPARAVRIAEPESAARRRRARAGAAALRRDWSRASPQTSRAAGASFAVVDRAALPAAGRASRDLALHRPRGNRAVRRPRSGVRRPRARPSRDRASSASPGSRAGAATRTSSPATRSGTRSPRASCGRRRWSAATAYEPRRPGPARRCRARRLPARQLGGAAQPVRALRALRRAAGGARRRGGAARDAARASGCWSRCASRASRSWARLASRRSRCCTRSCLHAVVERVPGRAGVVAGVAAAARAGRLPGAAARRTSSPATPATMREFWSFATNVWWLRCIAYVVDRRSRGMARAPAARVPARDAVLPDLRQRPDRDHRAARRAPTRGTRGRLLGRAARLRRDRRALGRTLRAGASPRCWSRPSTCRSPTRPSSRPAGRRCRTRASGCGRSSSTSTFYVVFSGWTDVAIALARPLGYEVAENFDRPVALALGGRVLAPLAHLVRRLAALLRLRPARRQPPPRFAQRPDHLPRERAVARLGRAQGARRSGLSARRPGWASSSGG